MKKKQIIQRLHAIGFKDDIRNNRLYSNNVSVKVNPEDIELFQNGRRLHFSEDLTVNDKIEAIVTATSPTGVIDMGNSAVTVTPTVASTAGNKYSKWTTKPLDVSTTQTTDSYKEATTNKVVEDTLNPKNVTVYDAPVVINKGGNDNGGGNGNGGNGGGGNNGGGNNEQPDEPTETKTFFQQYKIPIIIAAAIILFIIFNKQEK